MFSLIGKNLVATSQQESTITKNKTANISIKKYNVGEEEEIKVVGCKIPIIKKELAANSNQNNDQHHRTNVRITTFDPKYSSLKTNIKKQHFEITLADIKNHIKKLWRNFREFPPKVEDYTYTAKTIEIIDGEERDDWETIDDDLDIMPSFLDARTKENKIEIKCSIPD